MAKRTKQATKKKLTEETSAEVATLASGLLRTEPPFAELMLLMVEAVATGTVLELATEDAQRLLDFIGRARRVAASALTQRERT